MPKGHPNLGRHLTPREVALIHEMRADGYTAQQVAATIGCHHNTVLHHAPGRVGKVPVAPLREAFLHSPMTAADVARALGWWDGKGADSGRVKRTLGLCDDIGGHGSPARPRTLVDAENVQRIAEAIGIAPWAVMPDDDRPLWARERDAA